MVAFHYSEGRPLLADEISDLRLFTRMVAAGSLSETARRTYSSLPAVSRRLAALEARLGVRLIKRGPRRFTLTEEGSLLYDRAVHILSELDEAEAEASAKSKTPRGRLRVGAPLQIGRQRIAPLVADFTKQYPSIQVELLLNDAKLDVLGDELDVGLHVDLPSDGNVISRVLIASRRVVCATPEYLSRHPAPSVPAELCDHDCIRYVRGRHVMDRWIFMESGKVTETHIRGTLSTNNAEVMHAWALAGRGVGLKALWDIEDDLRTGRLIELLAPYACDELKLYAAYPSRQYLPPRTRVFIDFMARSLGDSVPKQADPVAARS
jgi:DNA-binding transcriptional LysR family regulator